MNVRIYDARMKTMKGSAAIEMAYLAPLVLLIVSLTISIFFYYYDKNILTGAAYEVAVVGSEKMREKEGITTEHLEEFFESRVKGKLIFFDCPVVDVRYSNTQIEVFVSVQRRGMRIMVEARMPITEPENFIRNYRNRRQSETSDSE